MTTAAAHMSLPTVSSGSAIGSGQQGAALWAALQPELKQLIGPEDYLAWFEGVHFLAQDATNFTLGVPSVFIAQWLTTQYRSTLETLLTQAHGAPLALQLQVAPTFATPAKPTLFQTPPAPAPTPAAAPVNPAAQQPEWLAGSRLDHRYTFATFVTGKSNQFACAAAQGVAARLTQPGNTAPEFNPFFLHGGVGLGKTHLMQAIGHAALAANPNTNILYLSAEQFLYKFIRALRDKNTLNFKELFRGVDVLMIDDIQFIAGKDSTQEEFFHTFNTLVQMGKQIILTADRSPHELANLEERLKSRLGSGLTVEVHAPEEETRLAILQTKAESIGCTIAPEVLQMLASHIASNVRELEGALNRLAAYSRLTGEALTPELAREQLRDLFRVYHRVITIDDIQQKVASQFNVRVADMHSPRRAREVARPRQVAMYLAKQLTSKSYPDIGRAFGGRDHTTVMHACETIVALIPRDSQLAEHINVVTRSLQGR